MGERDLERARELARRLVENVERVIVGKREAVELGVAALLARGHILIEDVPGVGKTMLAKSIARSTGCTFKRIQFTPDLLPGDITGVSVYNQRTGSFEFRPGPLMAQVVLADEVNRATPKTQSALLEAMEEGQVTVDGVTHPLPRPFLVMATQNPIEYEGTFPLPEAQLDRFLLRVRLGYPTPEEELEIIRRQERAHPIDALEPVATPQDILEAQAAVTEVFVEEGVRRYIVSVVEQTRRHPEVALGASPRASLALFRAAQVLALVRGRGFVTPDDVKALAGPVLAHRLILSSAGRMRGLDGWEVVRAALSLVPVPGARPGGLLGRRRE